MSNMSFMEKLLDGVEVEWKVLEKVFDIFAGGDVPKAALSDIKTEEFNIPILSNGKNGKSLYGWTDKAKVEKPSLTISARGTIGWTSYRDTPFFPIVRLLVLTPKIELNLKYAYYFMKTIESNYKIPEAGIPQLTKPMIRDIQIPIPCPNNPEKSLEIQTEIVRILDAFTELTTELTARKKQYNYYRDQLLSFDLPAGRQEREVEWKTLGEMALEFGRGKSKHRPRNDPKLYGGDIPFIQTGDIRNSSHIISKYTQTYSELGLKQSKLWPKGTLCITIAANIAETTILGFDACFPDSVIGFTANPEKSNAHYVEYLLSSFKTKLQAQSTGSAQSNIKLATFENIHFPFPSISEQERIVAILDKFDALTSSISEGLPREIELRQKQYAYYRDLLLSFPKQELELMAGA